MSELLTPLALSLKISLGSTLLVIIFGLPLAWILAKKDFPGKKTADILVTLPLVVPPSVMGYYLLLVFGAQGPMGKFLNTMGISVIFTPFAAVLASAVVSLPMLVRTAKSSISEVDQRLEDAFLAQGATPAQVAIHITFPLARRGILAGSVLAFARGLGEFGATLMVAGNIPGRTQTMPVAIYSAVAAGDYSLANLLVFLMTASSFVVLWLVNRWFKM